MSPKQSDAAKSAEKSPSKKKFSKDMTSKIQLMQGPKAVLPHIVIDGEDVTPFHLDPYVYEGNKERPIAIQDAATRESFIMAPQSIVKVESQRFHATLLQQKQDSQTAPRKSIIASSYVDDVLPAVEMMTDISHHSELTAKTLETEEETETKIIKNIPEHISLILYETDTIFFLDFPSITSTRGTEEADAVEEDNKMYDYLVKGKGRNRKMLTVAIQTIPVLVKARDTETNKVIYKNSSTYCSTWEMYDMFQKENKPPRTEDEEDEEENEEDEEELKLSNTHALNDEASVESYRLPSEDKQISKLIKSKAFFDALIVIERILGNNSFNEEQKKYKGLHDPDPFSEHKVYKYKLDLLWTYSNDATEGKCVTALAFNSYNEDIVAVTYGKYFYNDKQADGMVMIWNIKNPQQPERQYNFTHPITSSAFSKKNPNLLAVGFYNGDIKILDVSKREMTAIREDTCTSFEAVWSILWFSQGEEEDIMASFGDGKVCRFQIRGDYQLKCTQIMITAAAEGKLKGIKYLKKCEDKGISVNRYEEARCLSFHPMDAFTYFIGTSEGVVHRCSTNYYNEHMDLFKAHDGSIYTMKFSPFANKLFYTCGDDSRSRLWVDGIYDPLVISEPALLPILDVDWSPTHATIVASIRGTDVLVWDMQRKMYEPQSTTKSSKTVYNTVCRFTPNGRCLMVGDMAGDVRVYYLEDTPLIPFFPEHLVYRSLKKLLVTKPDLVVKLKKLGSLNFDKSKSMKYFE